MPNLPAPVVVAFLLEAALYFATCAGGTRRRIDRAFSRSVLLPVLILSALFPYCLYSLPLGIFHGSSLLGLAVLAAAAAGWYVWLPRKPLTDIGFLALMAAVLLSGVFGSLYGAPISKIPVSALGHLMWIRLGVMSALSFRGMPGVGLGLLPTWREWMVGVQHYLYFLPCAFALAWVLKCARFEVSKMPWWMILLTFVAMLWVVGLSEEFFFRGLLLQWIRNWTGRERTALVITSVVFGLVHLPFHAFPNWKFVILAAVAGWFYGRAYLRTGSIRSAMVAHALTNVTMKALVVMNF